MVMTRTAERRTLPRSHAVSRSPLHLDRRRRRGLLGLGYASPTAVVVGLFFVAPLGLVLWMSLNKWPLLLPPTYNAPANYQAAAKSQLFHDALWFTVRYTVIMTVLLFAASFGLALLVQAGGRRGVGFFRAVYFLPGVVGFATASLLFLGFLSNEVGPVNPLLSHLGLITHPIDWITGSPSLALTSIVTLVLWRFAGFNMLILLTGLQQIPQEVYEAARIDGATRVKAFRYVTLPLMRSTIALVLVMMITGSLLAFDQFYILTAGGPGHATTSVVMVIYRAAFSETNLGKAAAISVIVLIALIVLNVFQLGVLRRRNR
jgi:multiple sugar transport system permease protein